MKIVIFDTESTGLTGIMGRIMSASFFPLYNAEANELRVAPKPRSFRIDKSPWRDEDLISDRSLCNAIRDELEKYHVIVTWNGKLHDVPLLNARLAKWGDRTYQPQLHLDLMYYAGGNSMKIGSRKLANVQMYFDLSHHKTPLHWDTWQRAASGNKDAMNEVVEHCEADVLTTADAYWKLIPMVRNIHR